MKKNYPLLVEKFYQFEASQPTDLFLSEPVQGIYREFTWEKAGQEIRAMAAALQNMGLGADDKVCILSKNCAHWIMSDLAIAMAGCISVPLYPNITPESINEIILHSESKAIFIGKECDQLVITAHTGVDLITWIAGQWTTKGEFGSLIDM